MDAINTWEVEHDVQRFLCDLEAEARRMIVVANDIRVSCAASSAAYNRPHIESQPPQWAVEAWCHGFNVHYSGCGDSFKAAVLNCIQNISEGKHA